MAGMSKESLVALIKAAVNEAVEGKVSELNEKLDERIVDWEGVVEDARRKAHNLNARPEKEKGIAGARFVRAMAAAKGDPGRASRFAQKAWDDPLGEEVTKALQAGDTTGGGFMIPEQYTTEIIDLLRNRTIIRMAGVTTVPMPHGSLTMPKQTGDISSGYIGESQDIAMSQPEGGNIHMTAKKLAALVPISNDLLRYDIGNMADSYVRNNLVRHLAVTEDAYFIRGPGTDGAPKGLRFWAANSNVDTSAEAAGVTIRAQENLFTKMLQNLEGNNIPMTMPFWMMAPRTKNYMITARAENELVWPEMRTSSPSVHTYPAYISNNIPTNLGSGSNESEIYLVDGEQVLIGESGGIELEADSSASYKDGGTLVSAFSRDETVIRAILRHDLCVVHTYGVSVQYVGSAWGTRTLAESTS